MWTEVFIKMTDINFMKCISCFKNRSAYETVFKNKSKWVDLFSYDLLKSLTKMKTLKNKPAEYKYQHHDYRSNYKSAYNITYMHLINPLYTSDS